MLANHLDFRVLGLFHLEGENSKITHTHAHTHKHTHTHTHKHTHTGATDRHNLNHVSVPSERGQYMTFLRRCHKCSHLDSSNLEPGNTASADNRGMNNEQPSKPQHHAHRAGSARWALIIVDPVIDATLPPNLFLVSFPRDHFWNELINVFAGVHSCAADRTRL